jgi:hypothetical protein
MRVRPINRLSAAGALLGAWLLVGPAAGWAAEAPDLVALRNAAGPSVCLVTSENGYGLPLARASGFLLGKGGFVVTDLGTLAQRGVVRAAVQFPDGTAAVATQFGMADPNLGLAVIRLGDGAPGRDGLALASQIPALDENLLVVRLGWRWAKESAAVSGRLVKGPAAADLGSLLGVDPPAGAPALLVAETPRFDGAAGGPFLDKDGAVVGVALDVLGPKGITGFVVPGPAVRQALLSAKPELKPLAELPKPVWPVPVFRLAGDPVQAAQFAQTVRALRVKARCGKCSGKGQVMVERIVGTRKIGGMVRNIIERKPETCPQCQGEGVLFAEGLYGTFAVMAEQGFRLVTFAGTEPAAVAAAWKNARGVLNGLDDIGVRFRDAFARAGQLDLVDRTAALPRGSVLYAQVGDFFEGSDGRYVTLMPYHSAVMLAMRVDEPAPAGPTVLKAEPETPSTPPTPATPEPEPAADRPGGSAKPLAYGQWIIVAGAIDAEVKDGNRTFLHLLPFDWVPGPFLGQAPRRPDGTQGEPGDSDQPKRPKREGAPDFFGL